MHKFKRSTRVAELIKQEVSRIVLTELSDPRMILVTFTDCELSDDLKSARVFFSFYGTPKHRSEAQHGLDHAAPHIREMLKGRVDLRYLPTIKFIFDPSTERGFRVDELLREAMQPIADDASEPAPVTELPDPSETR